MGNANSQKASSSAWVGHRPIILVHGIGTEGEWQENLVPLLRHFFRPIIVRYDQYKKLGWIKVLLDPYVLFLGGGALFAAYSIRIYLYDEPVVNWAVAGPLIVAVLLFSFFGAAIRRTIASNCYRKQAGDYWQATPDIIAHSYGTFLTARILRQSHYAQARHIILLGSVLDRRYLWAEMKEKLSLRGVRNEWSTSDRVVKISRLVPGLRLGNPGHPDDDPRHIHEVPDPRTMCAACANGKHALVHNVKFEYEHSEMFLERSHATTYWLPFLWEIDPAEYIKLRQLCADYVDREHEDNAVSQGLVEEQLLFDEKWSWLGGRTLLGKIEEFIKRQGAENLLPNGEMALGAASILRSFCHSIVKATRTDIDQKVVEMLNPRTAISNAVASWISSRS